MGEVAEDMVDGTRCQCCGVFHTDIFKLKGKEPTSWAPQGFPWTCKNCTQEQSND